MEIRFSRYAELTSACWIETLPNTGEATTTPDRHPVSVVAHQNGEVVFAATATVATATSVPLRLHSAG